MKRLLYPERNRLLLALSVLVLIAMIVIARYSTWPALPGFQFLVGPIPDDSIPYDIAIGYLASYIFYLIQVYIPQRSREIKSLKSLQLYLKAYLRNASLFYAVLQDYDLIELPKCAPNIPAYIYKNKSGESFTENFKLLSENALNTDYNTNTIADSDVDGIYNFLLKAKYIYEEMANNQAFSTIDTFLLDQIQAINIPYWFEVYEKILILNKSGYGAEIQPFRSDDKQMELVKKMKMAIDVMEEYLGVKSTVIKSSIKVKTVKEMAAG